MKTIRTNIVILFLMGILVILLPTYRSERTTYFGRRKQKTYSKVYKKININKQ